MQCLIGNACTPSIHSVVGFESRGIYTWTMALTVDIKDDNSSSLNQDDYSHDQTRIPPYRRLYSKRTKSQARHRRPRTTSHSYTSPDQSPRRRTQLPGREHCQRRQSLASDTLWDSLQRRSRRSRGQRRTSIDVQYRRQGITNRRHGESHGSRSSAIVACCR